MNNETVKAYFSIEDIKITSFSFNEPTNSAEPLNVHFDPKGSYNETAGSYILYLSFRANESKTTNVIIEVNIKAVFKFKEGLKLAEIPSYFYKNSVAIVFPYLRAFVSNLTLQANINVVILPLMNLSSLEKPLKDNTSISE